MPTVLFINKTDRPSCDAAAVLAQLKRRLSGDVTDMGGWRGGALPDGVVEAVAERDEALLDRWMADAYDPDAWLEGLRAQFFRRQLFPVYSGSALNDTGVEALLDALCLLAETARSGSDQPPQGDDAPFRALVYKIRHDAQGGRLCFFKVLSGSLRPREEFPVPGGTARVNELRLYSGTRFSPISQAEAGMLCAAPGLPEARPGDVIGAGGGRKRFHTEPMLAATVCFDLSIPANKVLSALRTLEDEDPALSVSVNEATGGIELRVMGRIQLEVIRQLMQDRFAIDVDFGPMRVLYMETVAAPAVGVGHYEPLRHYAEVQLRLVPGPRGSGVRFESLCHVDELALNWQRLIETHVYEKAHRGVLTGAPLTDVVVQLLHGRAHLKHTEGGDFRQSTYRAIRNALMYARSVLLEPVCRFTLRAPADSYGKVMGDLARMHADAEAPQADGERFTVTGEATVAEFSLYNDAFLAATHGRGQLQYRLDHYAPCRDADAVIEAAHYNPLADDTPDSVFCAHGAGYTVPWNEVKEHAHCPVEE